MTYVLDASVAAKWFLPPSNEEFVFEAIKVQEDFANAKIRLIVPDLFWPEIGNILWKAVRQGRMSSKSVIEAIEQLRLQRFRTISSLAVIEHAIEIALTFDRTVYDAVYVTTAVLSNVHLLTADERLANALAAQFPVRWLGTL